ncbi:MAG: hypothetical protein VX822_05100 [Candidatus Neomarinimicrobiota bacterium]|nr:hypothetical protein [Candidatus Neomarinimicrobiota bacterium]
MPTIQEKSLDIPFTWSVNSIKMTKKIVIVPSLVLLLLSTQACYTQLAWFNPPEPEENQSTFSEYDPYGLEGLERSSDFGTYTRAPYSGWRDYRYDPTFWSYYGNYGSPYGLYSPYSPYGGSRLLSPYGYTYPYDVPGYGYSLATPVIGNEGSTQTPRTWERGGSGQTSSNLVVRREPSLVSVTAQPIKKQSPLPTRSLLLSESRRRWDVTNGNYDKPSYRDNSSSSIGSRNGGSFSSGRSISSGSSSGSSSSKSSPSSGRVTRRR